MSNGIKVGVLIVLAGALGFLGYSQFKKSSSNEITTRPATAIVENTTSPTNSSTTSNAVGNDESGTDIVSSADRPKTSLKFDKTLHDFGNIKQGDQVECVFKITNTGNEPLVIENAQGSCGCTVPDYPKDPITPGDTREVRVKFNSSGKKDKQSKTVTITANTDPAQTILTVQSFVQADTK